MTLQQKVLIGSAVTPPALLSLMMIVLGNAPTAVQANGVLIWELTLFITAGLIDLMG